jgi:hypothetical protein
MLLANSHGSAASAATHQVLQNIAQQGRESHAEQHDIMFGFNVDRQ